MIKNKYRYLISFTVSKKSGFYHANTTVTRKNPIKSDSQLKEIKESLQVELLDMDEQYINCNVIINNIVRL